ncbi:MAG TPA: sigma-54 dependent transcriptional regulator [Candidatus Saccharimonadales bacterium]|nr:sigma-54 dependent transcriptional regulator [Candidatus Saccharimonadales bacterium]
MSTTAKLLLIEDDAAIATTLQRILADEGYEVMLEPRGDAGLERARKGSFEVVITDLRLPGLNGLELVRELHGAKPLLPIIVMTAHGTTETAIEATKFGAYEYLIKPFEMPALIELVAKALENSRAMSQPVEIGTAESAGNAIVGHSRVMQGIYKEIGRVASKPVSVLILGETGTGKELIARAIYHHSDRAKAPFVAINCAAIPETLLESELFGHERGAFTGAEFRRIGRFEQANQGTIFLDEIGDMSLSTQVKLLRVLQEKSVQRLGGKEIIPVNVRVIAATHRDLEMAIREKLFREDLFYRLSVVVLKLPALRERPEDIPELVSYFLQKYGRELGFPQTSIQPEALLFLQHQPWPGNVRELENVLRKVLLLARGFAINTEHVHAALSKVSAPISSSGQPLKTLVGDLLFAAQRGELEDAHAKLIQMAEREIFSQAIQMAHGNQAKAARWLGVSRLTMREKLTQFGIHPSQENPGA